MPKRKITLSQTYVHSGAHYGPGVVEVDEAIYADLEARERALRPAQPAPVLREPEAPAVPRRTTKKGA